MIIQHSKPFRSIFSIFVCIINCSFYGQFLSNVYFFRLYPFVFSVSKVRSPLSFWLSCLNILFIFPAFFHLRVSSKRHKCRASRMVPRIDKRRRRFPGGVLFKRIALRLSARREQLLFAYATRSHSSKRKSCRYQLLPQAMSAGTLMRLLR